MSPASTDAAYDAIAHWYDDWVGDDDAVTTDPYAGPTLDLIGDVAGQHICDLACGQGRIARTLARRGARVVGIDNSEELLAIARQHDVTGIEYRNDDAHTLASCRGAEFDGVLCNMSLMDIADLTGTITSVHRILRPGGWVVFSTFHPCFNAPQSAEIVDQAGRSHRTVTDYFTEGFWRSDQRVGPPRIVGAYHRTLATLLNTVLEAGLVLRRVEEVVGPSAGWQEVPPVLAAVADKPTVQ